MRFAKMMILMAIMFTITWMIYEWMAKSGYIGNYLDLNYSAETIISPSTDPVDSNIQKPGTGGKSTAKAPSSGFYKWTDKNGAIHYTNEESRIPKEFRDDHEVILLPDVTMLDSKTLGSIFADHTQNNADEKKALETKLGTVEISSKNRVVLLGTHWCPNCAKVRNLLKELKVPFVDMNVEEDHRAMRHLLNITEGKPAVPVLLIDTKPVIGFQREQIIEMLGSMKPK